MSSFAISRKDAEKRFLEIYGPILDLVANVKESELTSLENEGLKKAMEALISKGYVCIGCLNNFTRALYTIRNKYDGNEDCVSIVESINDLIGREIRIMFDQYLSENGLIFCDGFDILTVEDSVVMVFMQSCKKGSAQEAVTIN